MKQTGMTGGRLAFSAVIVILVTIVSPLQGQAIIPEGADINQALLTVWVDGADDSLVKVHRITADWGESSVTWSTFQGSFDPMVAASFVADDGPVSTDVTDLVRGWVNSDYLNFGMLLEQSSDGMSHFHSSEAIDIDLRPQLEIHYSTCSGGSKSVLIKRPGDLQDGVRDSFIKQQWITSNNGSSSLLMTGYHEGFEKQSLVWFDIRIAPGTALPAYWKRHSEAWPVDSIEVGGFIYPKADAIQIMKTRPHGDMTIVMFKTLAAAKLNVLAGNDDSCIAGEIQAADDWLVENPVGTKVRPWGWDSPWRQIRSEHWSLVAYNLGWLPCADHWR